VTQQAVERAPGKLLTDENFREQFFASPELACWEAGFALSPVERGGLARVERGADPAQRSTPQTNQPPLPRSGSAGSRCESARHGKVSQS
jgi:hypothetical protein